MNGIHDMGGMHGMGPITHDPNEPVFHEAWEGRAWGLQRAAGPWGEDAGAAAATISSALLRPTTCACRTTSDGS